MIRIFQLELIFFLKLLLYKVIMYDRIVTHFAIAVVAFTQMSYSAFFYCQGNLIKQSLLRKQSEREAKAKVSEIKSSFSPSRASCLHGLTG